MPMNSPLHRLACLMVALLFPMLAGASEPQVAWEEIADEEGIKVFQRKVPGTSFVSFRGVGVMSSDIYDVYSVIFRHQEQNEAAIKLCKVRAAEGQSAWQSGHLQPHRSPLRTYQRPRLGFGDKVTFAPKEKRIYARFKRRR